MNSSPEHRLVLFFFFMLIVIVLSNSPSTPIQNRGIVQFETHNKIPLVQLNEPFIPIVNTPPIVNKETEVVIEKTEQFLKKDNIDMFLPKDIHKDGISLEKPQIDMRDISINEWRNDNNIEDKKQDLLLSDLRTYQQQYNEELEENKFKKMTLDEHRQQNIAEWKERVKNQTQNEFKN